MFRLLFTLTSVLAFTHCQVVGNLKFDGTQPTPQDEEARPPTATTTINPLVDDSDEMPVESLVRGCILGANASTTFDLLIDVAENPQTNEQSQRAQHSTTLGRFFGRWFGPLFIDYIELLVKDLQKDMNPTKVSISIFSRFPISVLIFYFHLKLYSVILDRGEFYYLNETTATFDQSQPTTTTPKPNAFVSFWQSIGASIQGFFHSSDGSAVAGSEPEDFDPRGATLPKITSRTLKARAAGEHLDLPTDKPNRFTTALTIVVTDGTQASPPDVYPVDSVILDIAGGWSSSTASRGYTRRNVIIIEEPQDLHHYVNIIRYQMCQSIGGIRGGKMLY